MYLFEQEFVKIYREMVNYLITCLVEKILREKKNWKKF